MSLMYHSNIIDIDVILQNIAPEYLNLYRKVKKIQCQCDIIDLRRGEDINRSKKKWMKSEEKKKKLVENYATNLDWLRGITSTLVL